MAISSPAANCISTWVASPIKSGPPLLRTGPHQDWLAPAFEVRRHSAGPSWSSNCASGACPCYDEGFVEEIEHFVTHCILEGKPPPSSLDDADDALRILEAAERSARGASTF